MKEEDQRRTQCSLRSGRFHIIVFWWGGREKENLCSDGPVWFRTSVLFADMIACQQESVSPASAQMFLRCPGPQTALVRSSGRTFLSL